MKLSISVSTFLLENSLFLVLPNEVFNTENVVTDNVIMYNEVWG